MDAPTLIGQDSLIQTMRCLSHLIALLTAAMTSGLLVVLGGGVFAAGPDQAVDYRVDRWTSERGLPQNSARALCQTRDGYLWVGTLNGLARFDGLRFVVFDRGNTPQMRSDAINDLAEDTQDGSLWIATGNGLLRYRHHRFERYGAEHGIDTYPGALWPATKASGSEPMAAD